MPTPKRVLCIMDMSGVGRSSLAVVLPVLAACGVQGCPLPTALFSTHTGGFGEVALLDTAAFAEQALDHYKEQEIRFDAIYTGYLLGQTQFDLARKALLRYPNALKVVDPALGDHGQRYSRITDEMVEQMKELCSLADLITPNYTESALLLGQQPDIKPADNTLLASRLEALAGPKRSVVITSVPDNTGDLEVAGCGPNGKDFYTVPGRFVPESYPGTGDLFTAAVTGLVLRGFSTEQAVRHADSFVEVAARATHEEGLDPRHGVCFEPELYRLTGLV